MRIAFFFTLLVGLTAWAAATPVDYTLECSQDGSVTVIGALSITEDEDGSSMHAMLLAGATCEGGTLSVFQGDVETEYTVTLTADGGTVTVTLFDGEDVYVAAVAEEVPQVALDNRVDTFARRAAAFERAALGGDGAGAGVAGAGDQREGASERRPETPANNR
jgi:hypothetical protein